ncbi:MULTISPECIES: hypothetical protein [Streptosporangium]|uniref:Integral membrane protein n=1 Tax=Streptosporangium brasiliense TaxID=47480 RepID=A0ABT9R7F8_9ACTN|nr:hypothetical protein [Streptosporangium brasiliense]MDP9864335.1 hypothetical protein [Streptosporangium brasiliense]
MVTVDKTGLMPRAAKSAQVVMMIQAMLGLVAVVLLSGLLFGGSAEPDGAAGFLSLTSILVVTGLIGWLAFRWDSRKRGVWFAAVAVESLPVLFSVVGLALDADLGVHSMLDVGLVLPAVAVVLLLLPSVRAWFDH